MSRYPQQPNQNPYGQPPPLPAYAQQYHPYQNQPSQGSPFDLGYQDVRDAAAEGVIWSFFNAVYAWMAVGLGVTAVVAYAVSQNLAATKAFVSPGASIAVMLGLVLLSFVIQGAAASIRPVLATVLFVVFAAIMGAALSYIFWVYKLSTIGTAFGATAGTFAVMSVVGYTTKRDLTRMGSILMMAVLGLFIASLVNFLFRSSGLSWFISYAAVIVFTLLTAYDTQRLKGVAVATANNPQAAASYAIVGSLSLYLNFINVFVHLLRILGDRR